MLADQISTPYKQYMYAYPHKTAYGKLNDIDIKPYFRFLNSSTNHLYVHLPFCQAKCGFCNLFSVAGGSSSYIDSYLDTIERQLAHLTRHEEVYKARYASLVLGGGTPLLLSINQLVRLLDMVEKYLPVSLTETYSVVETSPKQSETEKLKRIKERGVNRLSLGVQSFLEDELKTLGRSHSLGDILQALERIHKVGFDEVNLDLIYGIPGQTEESFNHSINRVLDFRPHEIFAYPLYVKEGTPLFSCINNGEDTRLALYRLVRDKLVAAGYRQTSMRRFTLDDKPDSGCGFDNTIALGCGGRSYLGNLHFCEPFTVNQQQCKKSIDSYLQKTDFMRATNGFILNPDEQKRRYAIKHLLYHTGIGKVEYSRSFNSNVTNDFPIIAQLVERGYAYNENETVKLNDQGLALSDYIGTLFISPDVQQKMDSYILP